MSIEPSPFRKEFDRSGHAVCLNHAGISPIPQRTAHRICEWAHYMTRRESFRYARLEEAHEQARIPCAKIMGCRPDEVSFVRNTSEGLSFVALGLEWKPGDEIITTDQEFPSNLVVWLDIAKRFGLTVHQVPSQADGSVSVSDLLQRINPRTRVLTVSSVQYGTGATVDLQQIGQALRDTDILFVVDAVQSLGASPLSVKQMGIDALAAGGHKWLLAPEGCGLFYLSAKGMQQVKPRVLGWHSVINAGNYDHITIEPRSDIRRFEAGTANVLGAVALGESISMLLEADPVQVAKRIGALTGAFIQALKQRNFHIHSPLDAQGHAPSGILILSHPQLESDLLHRHLASRSIEQVKRSKGIRFAPHFYQDDRDVNRVMEAVDERLAGIQV